jgi:hypothetical protein
MSRSVRPLNLAVRFFPAPLEPVEYLVLGIDRRARAGEKESAVEGFKREIQTPGVHGFRLLRGGPPPGSGEAPQEFFQTRQLGVRVRREVHLVPLPLEPGKISAQRGDASVERGLEFAAEVDDGGPPRRKSHEADPGKELQEFARERSAHGAALLAFPVDLPQYEIRLLQYHERVVAEVLQDR